MLRFSEHLSAGQGEAMFRHACAMGLEGTSRSAPTSRYKSGACKSWLKVKNPAITSGALEWDAVALPIWRGFIDVRPKSRRDQALARPGLASSYDQGPGRRGLAPVSIPTGT